MPADRGRSAGEPPPTPPVRSRLGPGAEFDRIRAFTRGIEHCPEVRIGPGDDAAVLADGTVISTDLSIEGVHFERGWIGLDEAGWRATSAALSDLAAMAASPVGVLASLAVPATEDDETISNELMGGVRAAASDVGAVLLGGDLSRSPGPVIVDIVAVGRVDTPLLRSGARTGDGLWLTGRPGAAAEAVSAWKSGDLPTDEARAAFARPGPRIDEARHLVERLGAHAGIDLSDGLVGDAGHIAAASEAGVLIDAFRIPLPAAIARDPDARERRIRHAMFGGEDYELLVALPGSVSAREVVEFQEIFDLPLTRVGEFVSGSGVRLRWRPDAAPIVPDRSGWDHFGEPTGGEEIE